jgi:hypothetical protein
MSEQSELKSHRRGRTTFEVPERKWPVVTRTMLAKASEWNEITSAENVLITSLLRGYVLAVNVETNLKRALQEAMKKRDALERPQESCDPWYHAQKLVTCLEAQLSRIEQIKEEWPLEIVG